MQDKLCNTFNYQMFGVSPNMDTSFMGTDHLHLSLTTRCNLACPFCTRLVKKHRWFGTENVDLDFKNYKKFLDNINAKVILLCGNFGDPIFYPDLFPLLSYIKKRNIKIKIHTNGTGHDNIWWKKLASILKPEDAIYFSIDGIENNFHTYRVNASWKKIMSHINILSSYDNGPSIIWKYILFRYNELDVNDALEHCENLRMDGFYLTKAFIPDDKVDAWKPSFEVDNYPFKKKSNYNFVYEEKNSVYVYFGT